MSLYEFGSRPSMAQRGPAAALAGAVGASSAKGRRRRILARSSLAFGETILRRGDCLVWFPEGGLSPDGRVQPFKPGLELLLSQFRSPVVPVLIQGTFETMPAGSLWSRSHQVNATCGHPTDVDKLKQQGGCDDPERIMHALRMSVEELRGKQKAHHA